MMIKRTLKEMLFKAGYVVSAYDFKYDHAAVRMKFLASLEIDVILDVGANRGQYACHMRKHGYRGRIVSFEPIGEVYEQLAGRARLDPEWETVHCALGSADETAHINISRNSWSSSLLDILPAHVESAPESAYRGSEEITVRALDTVLDDCCGGSDRLFLKIDTQGFGMEVLKGAQRSLKRISAIHLEMSLVPLYRDEPLMGELVTFLQGKGFALVAIEPEYFNPETGQQLQVNGLFIKTGLI